MDQQRILIVEDDPAIRMGVRDALEFSGFGVIEAADGPTGLQAALEAGVDLVLLDIMLPGFDGLELLGQLRQAGCWVPVIVLTARGELEDRVRGLRLGADDYVVKPFNAGELIARVEAVLRRSAERAAALESIEVLGRHVDFARREVSHADGSTTQLTQREAALLAYLAMHRGKAVSREELLLHVWGIALRGTHTRTVDMTIARLREQLKARNSDEEGGQEVILTVRGKGYMLAIDHGPSTNTKTKDVSR